MKVTKYLLLIPIFSIIGCLIDDPEKEQVDSVNIFDSIPPMNVIVLLDLSNRIDTLKHPDQARRDQTVIKSVLDIFGERQKQFGYLASKDKLSIVFADQANPAIKGFEFSDKLSLDMEDRMTHPKYKKKKKIILQSCSLLYQQAIKQADSGADIYTWLKDQFSNYHRDGKYENKVIVLTDGYLAFDKDISIRRPKGTQINWSNFETLRRHPANWEEYYNRKKMGFLPIKGINFDKTEVMLMEIEPRETNKNPHEFDLLKHFWIDWMDKMSIEGKVVKTFSDVNQLNYGLKKFLSNHE
ncbi:MAG: hypothetical protein JKY48_08365 [Flavobacteriales bacterium]|nr:hypothetical protein [Flavobacteriales bacterium]